MRCSVSGSCNAAGVSEFDLVVVGSGPAGQKAAIQAAKLGGGSRSWSVTAVGGVCVNTGTIPSKTIREAIIYLTGLDQRGIQGQGYPLKKKSRWTTSGRGCSRWSSASAT